MPRRRATALDYEVPLRRVRALVEDADDDTPLPPARLAREAGLALHHFHRVFRGMTGLSLAGYVRAVRLARAARQLRHTDRAVIDVALDAGYEAPEAFTRAFREAFGAAPTTFRAHTRPSVPAPVVTLRREPARPLWLLRHTGPYSGLDAAFASLFAAARDAGVVPTDVIGLNHDDPDIIAPAQLRYDVCLVAPQGRQPPAALDARTLSAGLYAVAVHRGPLDTLLDTYLGLIGVWAPRERIALHDEPVVERTLSDPRTTPADALATELLVRVVTNGDG
jgi:AraC family transcriptional regulator